MGCGSQVTSSAGILELDGPNGKREQIGRGAASTQVGTPGTLNPDGQIFWRLSNDGGTYNTTVDFKSIMTPATGSTFTWIHGPGGASMGTEAARLALKTVVPANHASYFTAGNHTITESTVGDQTALATYFIMANSAGGVVNLTIPAAAAGTPLSSRTLVIKDAGGVAGTNFITISPAAGNIDGAAAVIINKNFGTVTITERGGGNWGSIAVRGATSPAIISGTVDIPTGDKLEFNTNDLIIEADGTDAVVKASSTGQLVFENDQELALGTGKNASLYFHATSLTTRFQGADVSSAAAGAVTNTMQVKTGVIINTGAVVGAGGSGGLTLASGASANTNAGGVGHPSGNVTVITGEANATAGTAGATGTVTLETGGSSAGVTGDVRIVTGNVSGGTNPSGNFVVNTGTSAGGARGRVRFDATGFHPKGVYTNASFPSANALVYSQGLITLVFDLPNVGGPGTIVYTFSLPPDQGFLVLDAFAIKTGGAGAAGDAVQLRNDAGNPITQDMVLNVANTTVVRNGTLVTGTSSAAGGSTLKAYHTDAGGGSNSACRLVVMGLAVA